MRYLAIIGYWCVAIVVIATIFVSFDYTFSHTLFMGSLYLPALLCLRIMMPQVDFSNKKEGVRNAIFIILGVLILTMLLMLLANMEDGVYPACNVHSVMINPIFIALVLTAISLPQIYLERWLSEREKLHPQTIDFISDRHRVSLEVSDIAFVESKQGGFDKGYIGHQSARMMKRAKVVEAEDQVSMMDLRSQQVCDALSRISVETLTPIEAMNELYKLKRMLQ